MCCVGVPGLEPGTSSLSAKRSNRLSYTPKGRAGVHRRRSPSRRPESLYPTRSAVLESDQEPARDTDAQVVQQRRDRPEHRADHGVEDRDDEREQGHLAEPERVRDREARVAQDVLHRTVELAEDAGREQHHPDQDARDHEHDAEAQPDQERQLHHRPEVDVDQLEPDLLARGAALILALQFFGDAAHASGSSSPARASTSGAAGSSSTAGESSAVSRLRSLFLAKAMILSSSSNRAKTTPMVSRPFAGTPATADLTTLPLARTTSTSSSSSTMSAPARTPRSSFNLATLMPRPPRPWARY